MALSRSDSATPHGIDTKSFNDCIHSTDISLQQLHTILEKAFSEDTLKPKSYLNFFPFSYLPASKEASNTLLDLFNWLWAKLEESKNLKFNDESAFDFYCNQLKADLVSSIQKECKDYNIKFEDIADKTIQRLAAVIDLYRYVGKKTFLLFFLQENFADLKEIKKINNMEFSIAIPDIDEIEKAFKKLNGANEHLNRLVNDIETTKQIRHIENYRVMDQNNKIFLHNLDKRIARHRTESEANQISLKNQHEILLEEHKKISEYRDQHEHLLETAENSKQIQESNLTLKNKIDIYNKDLINYKKLRQDHNISIDCISKELDQNFQEYKNLLTAQSFLYSKISSTYQTILFPIFTNLTTTDSELESKIVTFKNSLANIQQTINNLKKQLTSYQHNEKCKSILSSFQHWKDEPSTQELESLFQEFFSHEHSDLVEQALTELAEAYAQIAYSTSESYETTPTQINNEFNETSKQTALDNAQKKLDTLFARVRLIESQRDSIIHNGINHRELLSKPISEPQHEGELKTENALRFFRELRLPEPSLSPITFPAKLEKKVSRALSKTASREKKEEQKQIEEIKKSKHQDIKPSSPAPILSSQNFWQRHWGKLFAGTLFGIFLAVSGLFTAGLFPAIVSGSFAALGIAAGILGTGALIGGGIGLIADNVPTQDEGTFSFLKRHKWEILIPTLVTSVVVGSLLTGGILAGVSVAIGAGVTSSLAVFGVSLGTTLHASIAASIITTCATAISGLFGTGLGAFLEARKLRHHPHKGTNENPILPSQVEGPNSPRKGSPTAHKHYHLQTTANLFQELKEEPSSPNHHHSFEDEEPSNPFLNPHEEKREKVSPSKTVSITTEEHEVINPFVDTSPKLG